MHVWIVVMIGVGAIIDGIVVVVPIVAHRFILHVTEMVITMVRPCHRVLEKPEIKPEKRKLTECCGVHEGPPGQP